MSISNNYTSIRRDIPDNVTIVVSCKNRTSEEIKEVIEAGATDLRRKITFRKRDRYTAL